MKRNWDKLKRQIKLDRNLFIFLIVLMIIGIIVGSLFVTLLSKDDQGLTTTYLNTFLDRISSNQLDYMLSLKNTLISNVLFVIIIWLLGISVIGLPIMIIMYFYKAFTLGFSIGSILFNYHFKGIVFALVYALGQAILLLSLMILLIYAMSFSFKMINCIFKKKALDFKLMINKYTFILGIILASIVLVSLYDVYIVPNILSKLLSFIR